MLYHKLVNGGSTNLTCIKHVYSAGVFGKAGEIQTNLCLAFGPNNVTYSGTLSGEIYKWKGNNLSGTIPNAHTVSLLIQCLSPFISSRNVFDYNL